MTATIWPKEMLEIFKPDFIAPAVGYLTSEACKETGSLIEVSGGWVAKYRWIRSAGYAVRSNKVSELTDTGTVFQQDLCDARTDSREMAFDHQIRQAGHSPFFHSRGHDRHDEQL
jgi:hypothetical protein